MVRLRHGRVAMLMALSLSAGAAYALADSTAREPGGLPEFNQSPTVVSAPEQDQAAAYAVLQRPRRPADELPRASRRVIAIGPEQEFGANADLARAIGSPAGSGRTFLVPGHGVLCLVDAGAVTCNATTEAAGGRLVLSLERRAGSEVIGAAPDGMDAVVVTLEGGGTERLAVVDNAYRAQLDETFTGFD